MNRMVAGAADVAFGLMDRFGIDAHQVRNGWIQPAHNAATLARARQTHDEWKALGAHVSWFDAADVSDRIGSAYAGGWMAHNSGHINPFALTAGLAGVFRRGIGSDAVLVIRGLSGANDAGLKEVDFPSAVHLAFYKLELGNLPLCLSI